MAPSSASPTEPRSSLSDYPKEALVDMSLEQLLKIEGLSKAKAKTLLAAFELAAARPAQGLGRPTRHQRTRAIACTT